MIIQVSLLIHLVLGVPELLFKNFRLVYIYKNNYHYFKYNNDTKNYVKKCNFNLNFQVNVALRNNFFQLPILVGILNGTSDDQNVESPFYQEDQNEAEPFDDFINFLASSLNSR